MDHAYHYCILLIPALHIACGSQHPSCAEVLLNLGAHNQPDDSGKTPSQLAIKENVKRLFVMDT